MKSIIEQLEERRNARKRQSEKMALDTGCKKIISRKQKFTLPPSDTIKIKHPKAKQ